jgi:hypothetical protein
VWVVRHELVQLIDALLVPLFMWSTGDVIYERSIALPDLALP